jgi:hypothetical protein
MKDDPLDFLSDPASYCANYVSPTLVKEGAQALSLVDGKAALINDHEWHFEQFHCWRRLYVEAAAHGDALCSGVC